MDEDADGKISIKQFKTGLKILHIKDEKLWTFPLIKKLFVEFDMNKDGQLDLMEFSNAIKFGKESLPNKVVSASLDNLKTDNDDEDDKIFSRQKVVNDGELFRKVSFLN